mgnify:CR=1 FL=1
MSEEPGVGVEIGIWPKWPAGPIPKCPTDPCPDFSDFPPGNYVPLIDERRGIRRVKVNGPFDIDTEVESVLGLVRDILRTYGTVSLTLLDHPETIRRASLGV